MPTTNYIFLSLLISISSFRPRRLGQRKMIFFPSLSFSHSAHFFPTVFQGFRLSPRRFSSRSRSSILSLVSLFSSGFSQTFELQFESYGRNDEPIKRVVRELSETPSEHQSFPWANQSGVDQEWRMKFPRDLPNALLPKRQMAETGRRKESKIFGQELWAADNETSAFNCQVR